ncbi:hypothetical protein ACHAXT_012163 [Thalassiosira profunda]
MAPARRSSGRRPIASIATSLACTIISASAAPERTFLSGSVDTSHIIHIDGTIAKRHQLVCFHRGGGYAPTVAEGREKCCRELYQSGLLSGDDRGYCLDHVALVPDLSSNSGDGGVRPAFYLALDKAADSTDASPKSYLQRRQLMVLEDKEQERLQDGPRGVDAYSPFHLEGFASDDGPGSDGDQEKTVLPLEGRVGGTISSEGGMHRAFRQRVTLSLSNAMRITENRRRRHRQVAVKATILLPIPESIFVDADDPLLVEYEGRSADGVSCTAGVESSETTVRKSTCSVDFIHPETIDIEQPAFASRQYVVAYQIVATLDLASDSSGNKPGIGSSGLSVAIDYGTTLHVRYPSPIAPHIDGSLVPIVIEQPVLYAASATLEAPTAMDGSDAAIHFKLRTTGVNEHRPPDPVVIRVAAGSDGDYGWVTLVTMASALIGGLMLMRSLDEASVWC